VPKKEALACGKKCPRANKCLAFVPNVKSAEGWRTLKEIIFIPSGSHLGGQGGSVKGYDGNFRGAADPHGRAPGAYAAGGIKIKIAYSMQAVIIPLINQIGEDLQRPELAVMGVSGKLQRNVILSGNFPVGRFMKKENGRFRSVDHLQDGLGIFFVSPLRKIQPHQLNSSQIDDFIP
jgi:hypothetical protein